MMTGIELIAKERQEQIEKHGYDLSHDASEHTYAELGRAACAIAYDSPPKTPAEFAAPDWAWDIREFKQTKFGRDSKEEVIERLMVAGALLAAAIDRLQAFTESK